MHSTYDMDYNIPIMNREKITNIIKPDKPHSKYLLYLLILSLLYVFPIILADRYYNDDLSRSLLGASEWNGDGRPLTELIMLLINFGRPLADISPLPLMMSTVLLSYSITQYIKHNHLLKTDKKDCFLLLYAGFLVIANPFLIPDLSYKFDCLTMVLSICLPFLAYSVTLNNTVAGILFNLCVVLAVLCLFQPSLGLYVSLFLLELFFIVLNKNTEEPVYKKTFISRIVGGLTGVIIYVTTIAPVFVDKMGWRAKASSISFSLTVISLKLSGIFSTIKRYTSGIPKSALLPFILLFLISWISLILYVSRFDLSSHKRFFFTVYVALLPALLFFSSVSPLLFLEKAQMSDHVLTGLCAVLPFVFGIAALYTQTTCKKLVIILIIPCIIFNYSYIYAYGSALRSQKEYETFIIQDIAEDIQEADLHKECTLIGVSDKMPKSRQLQTLCNKYPQFNAIVPVYMYDENWIGTSYLNHYLQQQLMFEELDDKDYSFVEKNRPFSSNSIYSLYKKNDKILLFFNP